MDPAHNQVPAGNTDWASHQEQGSTLPYFLTGLVVLLMGTGGFAFRTLRLSPRRVRK